MTGPSEDDVDLAVSWDAKWYQRIADGGYPDELPVGPDGRVQQNPWAFYPLFPLTARCSWALTGLDFATVAPLLALLAGRRRRRRDGPAAARHGAGRPSGAVLGVVAVWAALPTSPVLQMAYTESFSMLLLVAFLLLVVRRRWWGAAAVVLALGLTRPIALPLAVVVVVALRDAVARARHPAARRPRAVGDGRHGGGHRGLRPALDGGRGRRHRPRDAYPTTMTAWRGEGSIDVVQPWVELYRLRPRPTRTGSSCRRARARGAAGAVAAAVRAAGRHGVDLRLKVWAASLRAVPARGGRRHHEHLPLHGAAVPARDRARRRPPARGSRAGGRWRTTFWVVAGIVGQVGWIWWLVLFQPPSDWPP